MEDLSYMEDTVGLVPGHAYAILRVVEVQGHRLVRIKNPWAHLAFKGKFSATDNKSWTPELERALDYNRAKAKQIDNGVFWMDYQSLCRFFNTIYMNWNPSPDLFPLTIKQHKFWPKSQGPKNDAVMKHYNPQYMLTLNVPTGEEALVWFLLSKHMTSSKREQQDKQDFCTLHIYDKVSTLDRVVHSRSQGNVVHRGVYMDSPHYFHKMDVSSGAHKFTILISQYEKKHDISFTLSVYSNKMCTLRPPKPVWENGTRKKIPGAWGEGTCGGCPNNDPLPSQKDEPLSYPQNPQYQITVPSQSVCQFWLEAPMVFSVNIKLFLKSSNRIDDRAHYSKDVTVGDSGAYRPGFTFVEKVLQEGTYLLLPSTFKNNQRGGYNLVMRSTSILSITKVR